jgi:hypothetical protein
LFTGIRAPLHPRAIYYSCLTNIGITRVILDIIVEQGEMEGELEGESEGGIEGEIEGESVFACIFYCPAIYFYGW